MVLLSVIPALYKVVFEKVFKRLFVSSSKTFNEWLPTTHEKKDYIGPSQPALVQILFFFTLSYPAHCPSGLKAFSLSPLTVIYMAIFLAFIKASKPLYTN
jgi:hypothetical protein